MSLLSGREVARYCDSYVKINPNGVDLAPIQVMKLPGELTIFLHNEKRGYVNHSGKLVEGKRKVLPDRKQLYHFHRGSLYELRFPRVRIPARYTGLAFPRSSINRLGIVKLETAVFDSGYVGEPTQTIFTPLNARVHKDEAMIQLVLIRNEKQSRQLYSGRYQNEKRA